MIDLEASCALVAENTAAAAPAMAERHAFLNSVAPAGYMDRGPRELPDAEDRALARDTEAYLDEMFPDGDAIDRAARITAKLDSVNARLAA